jgi:glycopeptide antibiotics resistance protein
MTILLLKYRSFDITDSITNTIGGILGYFIYKKIDIYLLKHKE